MKIHAYKVSTASGSIPLAQTLQSIHSASLDERWRQISYAEMRAEDIEVRDSLWYFDFVRRRYSGPGKVAEARPIEGFNFDETETFGEETAVLFDESSGYILIQYNHYGARSTSIATYFSNYLHLENNGYSFQVKLREDSESRLARKTQFRRLNIGLDLDKLLLQNREAGYSLERSIRDSGEDLGASTLYISFGLARGQRGSLIAHKAKMAINHFLGRLEQDDSPVRHLSLSAKDDPESPTEAIDFVAERLVYENSAATGADLRVTREERYNLLKLAHTNWRSHLRRS